MNVKTIKKNSNDLNYLYRNLLATPYGSLIQTAFIYQNKHVTPGKFIHLMKKAEFPFTDDPDFIEKTLKAVGLNIDCLRGRIVCVCENEFNCLFCPGVIDEGEMQLLPLTEDGSLFRSQVIAQANDTWKLIEWSEDDSN